jgi:hypothetical protein
MSCAENVPWTSNAALLARSSVASGPSFNATRNFDSVTSPSYPTPISSLNAFNLISIIFLTSKGCNGNWKASRRGDTEGLSQHKPSQCAAKMGQRIEQLQLASIEPELGSWFTCRTAVISAHSSFAGLALPSGRGYIFAKCSNVHRSRTLLLRQ